jgi:ABC-type transporter Mla subunit MlaD
MDWLKDLTNHIVNAVAGNLKPKFDALIGKQENVAHQVETLRSDVSRVATKVDAVRDKLDHHGGGLDPAQLKRLSDLTTRLRVSATTLKAAVAAQPNP